MDVIRLDRGAGRSVDCNLLLLARSYAAHETDSFCYYDFKTGSTLYLFASRKYSRSNVEGREN